jgi:hypothetical protein
MELLHIIQVKINTIRFNKGYEADYILINPKDCQYLVQKNIDEKWVVISRVGLQLFGVPVIESAEITQGNPVVVTTMEKWF